MEAKMADLLLAEEAEEARETPEPPSAKNENGNSDTNKIPTNDVAETSATSASTAATTAGTTGGDENVKSKEDKTASTLKTGNSPKASPPTVKINGTVSRSNAAEKSPVDAISTWSEEGCHVFMPNWGETSSTNVSLLGTQIVNPNLSLFCVGSFSHQLFKFTTGRRFAFRAIGGRWRWPCLADGALNIR